MNPLLSFPSHRLGTLLAVFFAGSLACGDSGEPEPHGGGNMTGTDPAPGGGGSLPSPGGSGGGTPLTGEAEVFLAAPDQHTYSDGAHTLVMESLPEDGVFPDGQKMYIGAYELPEAQMPTAASHGFTVAGSHGGVAPTSRLEAAVAAGMKYMPLIREINSASGGGPWLFDCYVDGTPTSGACMGHEPSCSGASTIGIDGVIGWAEHGMQRWMDVDDDGIYGWLYSLDDCRTRNRTSTTNQVYQAMSDYDPKKRTVGDFGFGSSYTTNGAKGDNGRIAEITNTISQIYFHGGDFVGDGDGYHKSRMAIGLTAEKLTTADRSWPSNNGKPRLLVQGWLFAFAWNVVPEHNSDPDYFRRQYLHDMLLSLMMGSNGIHIYQLKKSYADDERNPCGAEYDIREDALYWATSLLTANQVEAALLWGKRTDHAMGITSSSAGDISYTTRVFGNMEITDSQTASVTREMITFRDIQYQDRRYIIATNSMPTRAAVEWWSANPDGVSSGQANPNAQTGPCVGDTQTTWAGNTPTYYGLVTPPPQYDITTTLHGFPNDASKDEVQITELVSGDTVVPNDAGEISVTLEPLQSVIYEVEAAPLDR